MTWQRVDTGALAPAGTHAQVNAVDAGPPWLIGGALVPDDGSEPTPAVWSSTDARTWQARAMVPITPDGVHSRILSVAHRGEVTVALGNRPSPLHGNARPTVWRAVGAGPFLEVPIRRELFGGPDLLTFGRVVAIGPGFGVAGSWDAPGGEGVAVWSSDDGAAWTRTDRDPALHAPRGGLVRALAITGGSTIVVAGQAIVTLAGRPGADRPALWRAASGTGPWSTVPLDTDPAGRQGSLDQIAIGGQTGAALGWSGDTRALTVWWTSDGGRSWKPHVLGGPAPAAGHDERGIDLAGDDRIMVAAAAVQGRLRIWSSPAGRQHWAAVAPPADAGSPTTVTISLASPDIALADPAAGQVWTASMGR